MGYTYDSGRQGLYRSRDGVFFGVCRGTAEYFDISVFCTRVITVIGFILTGFFPVVVGYIIAALLMKPGPRYRY
ncbi:MAG: PspC domain-containing protein [Candidatus Hydrogenedentes bacterium]|nr:PspC domain-containing protein [Candidatus Hydrogenedentota bacterium]